ncbi:MAG: RecQ family ATP-dependent DNA helicase [Prolixibacteraceae bacterium]|jgi:ATP-dependent DNA helicase RecQ|nr:RecQ family ATP-dependent DNA helicase [Prolixibacteraceae bacterium]MBT6999534.1 RecQ family ATP-dependent DNA helicase [Prolixibacteraceae bacterium]MBT7396782.1 RecQ family ATP-dependent DNA helicase [Prolixibacteraceae bacterium]
MENFKQILTRHWGFSDFRPLQLEIIQSVASGKDTLGLMPTGGGKSITFQVYSLSQKGICIVITPLIALMRDQVENLNKRGIKALAIHSGMSSFEIKITLDNAVWGDYKFLYISPERLNSERFKERLAQMDVNLVTIDEAHCISQWGYDFRPSYINIIQIKEILPDAKFLALTATATLKVADDIQEKLAFKEKNILKVSFQRENLKYLVRHVENKLGYLLQALKKVSGSGIIYVRSRRGTREISDELRTNKISADFYHAGLSSRVRNKKQDQWQTGKTRIIVATNAFGMGIDKPDVRFVIHVDSPDSLEAYFQEAGRAGRDGKKAAAVLLFNNTDKTKLKKHVVVTFPEIPSIKRIYQALCNHLQIAEGFGKSQIFEFNLQNFSQAFKFQQAMVYNSLKILQREGYLEYTAEVDSPSRIYFTVSRDDLYKFQVANSNLDSFIKLILRSYTGLFTGYVYIDEELLAKRASLESDQVYNFLKHLRKSKIIDYVPRNQKPFIYFNKERIKIERLKISKENYDTRKLEFLNRINSVINYATNSTTCRSQILLKYFGETGSNRCGQCDVCTSMEKLEISTFEFDRISNLVKKILDTPCTYEQLLFKLKGNQEKMRQVVKWLLDNKKIVYRIDNKLEWMGEG